VTGEVCTEWTHDIHRHREGFVNPSNVKGSPTAEPSPVMLPVRTATRAITGSGSWDL
jgi:hypothetical protein